VLFVQKLLLAGADEGLEHLHAEVIDVLGVLKGIQEFPIFSGVVGGPLYDLFGLLCEPSLHLIKYNKPETAI
jgi:hypothetical protein